MGEIKGRYIIGFKDIPSEREPMPELSPERRRDNFEEVELGFSPEGARKEALRCLSCRRCLGCALCLAVCEQNAIVFEQEDEHVDLTVDTIFISDELGTSVPSWNGRFGYGKHINVITSFELERMLANDGPYGGLILRPFDGEIPRKAGFILDPSLGLDTEDAARKTLSHAHRIAALFSQKLTDLEVSLFISVKKELGFPETRAQGIVTKNVRNIAVTEAEESGNLLLTFTEGGETRKEAYDILVLFGVPEISSETKALLKMMGMKVGQGTIFPSEIGHPSPIETEVSNVFII